MATVSAVRPLASDPLRSFKFNVVIPTTINRTITGQSMARFGFMSVSGLGVAIEPLTYREGGDNLTTRKMPGQADFNPITLSRGLFATDNDNWVWMNMLFSAMYGGDSYSANKPMSSGHGPDFRTKMYINILDHPNTEPAAASANTYSTAPSNAGYSWPQQSIVKVSFKLYSAWIGTLAYSDLDAGGNAVGVEQLTINHEGFDMQWAGANKYVQNPTTW